MSRKSNKVQGRQQIAEREPTPQELAVAEKFEARRQNQQPGARLTAKRLSETNVGADLAGGPLEHLQAALLMENLATADPDAAMFLLRQVSRLVEPGGGDYAETQVNGVMALIRAINPANELETMLAVQMVATHLATMEHAWRLRVAETLAQMDFAERALSRLTRTFTMQMEALKRHRGSGEQKVTVRHVHEHAGDGSAASLQQGERVMKKAEINPMNGCVFPNARQCSARSKRTGCRCKAPAVTGWNVCRFHGARGGQPAGVANSRFRHGFYSREAMQDRQATQKLIRMLLQRARF